MLRISLILVIMFLSFSLKAENLISEKNLVGSANLSVLFLNIYDAKLYSKSNFSFEKPFALSLTYNRNFKGKNIAKRSIKEMKKIGLKDEDKIQRWQEAMNEIFPNVKKGDEIIGYYKPDSLTKFTHNGNEIGIVEDKDFSKWFFGIWLDENTSQPEFRKKLLGN